MRARPRRGASRPTGGRLPEPPEPLERALASHRNHVGSLRSSIIGLTTPAGRETSPLLQASLLAEARAQGATREEDQRRCASRRGIRERRTGRCPAGRSEVCRWASRLGSRSSRQRHPRTLSSPSRAKRLPSNPRRRSPRSPRRSPLRPAPISPRAPRRMPPPRPRQDSNRRRRSRRLPGLRSPGSPRPARRSPRPLRLPVLRPPPALRPLALRPRPRRRLRPGRASL